MGALSMVGRLQVVDKRLEQLGLWSKLGIMSAFKEPEILDDLVDHWGAGIHAHVCSVLCACMCVCVCKCVCACACVRACVSAWQQPGNLGGWLITG